MVWKRTVGRRPFLTGITGLLGSSASAGCLGLREGVVLFDKEEASLAFEEVASDSGFEYQHVASEYKDRRSLITNAGVYITDFANNGRDDLLALGGEKPVLFENVGGEFQKADLLPSIEGSVSGALFFDSNNDGTDDLLLLRIKDTPLFLKHAEAEYVREDVGFDRELSNPIVASAADYTGNGVPDVLIGQCGNWDEDRPIGAIQDDVGEGDNGNPNVLYRNEAGAFTEVADSGIDGERWTLAVSFVDLTGDGTPDIYAANDYNYDVLYINQGNGTFKGRNMPDSHRNAMSAAVADISGNHRLDVFVTNIKLPSKVLTVLPAHSSATKGNNLFVNQGDGEFTDEAGSFGVTLGGWGWAAVIADFQNKMLDDIFHTNEHLEVELLMRKAYDISPEEVYSQYPSVIYPRFFGRVDKDHFVGREASALGFQRGNGRGAVALDIDGDGSLDIAVADATNPYKLYENTAKGGNWLRIRIENDSGTTSLGSEVYLTAGDVTQFAVKHANTDFLSQGSRRLHFGLGSNESADVSVHWPAGVEQQFYIDEVNRSITVRPDGSIESQGS